MSNNSSNQQANRQAVIATVPTQKNILEIIKSNVSFIADISTIIVNATHTISLSINSIKTLNEQLNSIYDKDGLFFKIESINSRLNKAKSFEKNIIKQKFFKLHLKEIVAIIKFVHKINEESSKIDAAALKLSIDTIDAANHIISILDNIKVNILLPIKIDIMRLSLWKFRRGILRNVMLIGGYIIRNHKKLLVASVSLPTIMYCINLVINSINSIKLKDYIFALGKIIILKSVFNDMRDLLKQVSKLDKYTKKLSLTDIAMFAISIGIIKSLSVVMNFVDSVNVSLKTIVKLYLVNKSINMLANILKLTIKHTKKLKFWDVMHAVIIVSLFSIIFQAFKHIKNTISVFGLVMFKWFKVWGRLYVSTNKLFDIFSLITKRARKFKFFNLLGAIVKITLMTIIFKIFEQLMKYATIAALLSVPFSICAVPLLISIIVLGLILDALILSTKTITLKQIGKILILSVIAATLSFIGLELFLLSLVAINVLKNFHWILLLMSAIMIVVFMMIPLCLAGALLTFIGPFAVTGLFALTAIISALIIVAVELRLLQTIELDRTLILNNVDAVLSTCRYIIDMLFAGDKSGAFDKVSQSNSWLGIIVNITKGAGDLIKMIAASAILFFTLVSVTLILFTVGMLLLMQSVVNKLNKRDILSVVDTVLQISDFIVKAIFGNATYDKELNKVERTPQYKNSNFIQRVFRGIGDLITMISASAMVMMTAVSIGGISLMCGMLKSIQNAEFDENTVRENVAKVIKLCKLVIDTVNAPSDTKEKNKSDGIIGKALSVILPSNLKYALDAIISMPFIAMSWINIGMITGLIKGLKTIEDLPELKNIETNVIKVLGLCKTVITRVKEENFNIKELTTSIKASQKLKRLIKSFISLGNIEIAEENQIAKNINYITNALDIVIKRLIPTVKRLPNINASNQIISSVKDINAILKQLTAFANINIKDSDSGLQNYIDLVDMIVKKTDKNKNITRDRRFKNAMENVGRYSDILRRITSLTNINISEFDTVDLDGHERFINNNIKFLDKINDVDSKKLRRTANLYKQLRHFSESINGNFDRLAEVLAEKLLPVLDELKEVMTDIPSELKFGFQNTSASIAATTAPTTKENVTAQVNRENPNLSAEDVDKIVATRMNDKAKADANSVAAKLDELTALLKGFSGEYVKVQTI